MGVAWNGNNIGGSTKRAVGIAMHVGESKNGIDNVEFNSISLGFGNLGGVVSGFAYRSVDAPRYFSGHGLLIATTTMSLFLSLFMHLHLVKENARRDAAMQEKGIKSLDDYTEEMKVAQREAGDNATVRAFQKFRDFLPSHPCHDFAVLPLHYLENIDSLGYSVPTQAQVS